MSSRYVQSRAAATLDCQICALLDAAAGGDADTIDAIVAVGTLNVNSDSWSPRRIAARLQHHWEAWGAEAGVCALHCASEAGHAGAVVRLLEHGAHVDAVTRNGMTPLCLAAWGGHAEVVGTLLRAGADVARRPLDRHGGDGPSALQLACFEAEPAAAAECVRELLAAGASASAVDARGRTALHAAAGCFQPAACRLLVAAGAFVRAADDDQRTPCSRAPTADGGGSRLRADVLRELRWVPAVRLLWLGHSARGGEHSPLRRLPRDVLQLVGDAVLASHRPEPQPQPERVPLPAAATCPVAAAAGALDACSLRRETTL